MKKVLHIISSNGFYGAENVLLQLCLGLRSSSQFQPVVGLLTHSNKGHLPLLRECKKHQLECIEFTCKGRFDRMLICDLKKFINENNIEMIHSHGYKSNFYAYLASKSRLLLVTTCHNWIVSGFKMRCFIWLDKFLLRRFDKVICVSKPLQDELKKWRVAGNRLFLIYNGIDLIRFQKDKNRRNKIRDQLGVADSDTVIGFVGRITKEKGVYLLMECAKTISQSFPDTRFVLVGDGPSRPELEDDKDASVIFAGEQSDISSYYSAFDVFVLPSFTEGLPMVILEAMATGLPVVATGVGSIPDVVEDGKTGILVRPGNRKDIQKALVTLIQAPQLVHEMGGKGKARVNEFFSAAQMITKYLTIYNGGSLSR